MQTKTKRSALIDQYQSAAELSVRAARQLETAKLRLRNSARMPLKFWETFD